jgi:hypothetical protein
MGSFHVKSSDSACMEVKSMPIIKVKIIGELEEMNVVLNKWRDSEYLKGSGADLHSYR